MYSGYTLLDGGAIAFDEIIPEGKGRMSASAYINGRKINVGDKLN